MDEAEDDALELHSPPDPAFEVEVEADNTWRIDDAPVDPGPRPVLKKGAATRRGVSLDSVSN